MNNFGTAFYNFINRNKYLINLETSIKWYYLDRKGNIRVTRRVILHSIWWSKAIKESLIYIADTRNKKMRISTVFLTTNHNFYDKEPPFLYETMVFGGKNDLFQDRYVTKKEAIRGHIRTVAKVGTFKMLVQCLLELAIRKLWFHYPSKLRRIFLYIMLKIKKSIFDVDIYLEEQLHEIGKGLKKND